MTNPKSTIYYRNAVKDLCIYYNEDELNFFSYLRNQYDTSKDELDTLERNGFNETAIRNGIYVLATGLLTYGQIEVVQDIVDNVPTSGKVRRLTNLLPIVLPLPDDVNKDDKLGLLNWLKNNQDCLMWNESELRFDFNE